METTKSGPLLVLSIHSVHADRIFTGRKRYELRKLLPRANFSRVYFYQNSGVGIVGCADVVSVTKKSIDDLWTMVGSAGSTKKGFFAYFAGWDEGYAIRLRHPVRFSQPLYPKNLKEYTPTFTAPQSFLLIRPENALHAFLEGRRGEELSQPTANLRRIKKQERELYRKLVISEVAPKYDDITEGFAESILRTHDIGRDINGIFTTRKEVLSICTNAGRLIGFTTLTHKIGGSLKTGPTILLRKFRQRGFGQATRRALESHATRVGARKIYCTCPDNDKPVIAYLLKAGYRIEAHLSAHYCREHGELVFGKLLEKAISYRPFYPLPSKYVGHPCGLEEFRRDALIRSFQQLFSRIWRVVDRPFAASVIGAATSNKKVNYEDKPLKLVCLRGWGRRCVGLLFLVPKRGGAVKAICLCSSSDPSNTRSLVVQAEKEVRRASKRKLYFVHPIGDSATVEQLRSLGYRIEGVLREPYAAGQDAIVLSKLF